MIKKYLYNIIIWLDQGLNTVLGGCPDETVSSRIGRIKLSEGGVISWAHPFEKIVDPVLEWIEPGHSVNAIEHNKLEQIKEDSALEGDHYTG